MDCINYSCDLLIIGRGLAGLSAGIEASNKNINVAMSYLDPGASPYIMGFNVPIGKNDSNEVYLKDTLESGCNINNHKLASMLINNSKSVLQNLESFGIKFDKKNNNYYLMQPLSCSFPRLVIHNKNQTGRKAIELFNSELIKRGVKTYDNTAITHLIKEKDKVIGACGFDLEKNRVIVFQAKAVLLATGGCCGIYTSSTNSPNAIGEGYAMAYDIGAELIDMEFIQFEPCIAVYPKEARRRGLVTILFNEGGKLYNNSGKRFMLEYGKNGESTHKNILARAIFNEIKNGNGTKNGGVYFDVRDVPVNLIEKEYLPYLKRFLAFGIDIRKEPIEVAPAAHTSLGGIKISNDCSTSIRGLYACGEVAGGIHGANRIGGNSGTEVFVFGKIAGESLTQYFSESNKNEVNEVYIKEKVKSIYDLSKLRFDGPYDLKEVEKRIREIVSKYSNVVRDEEGLTKGLEELNNIKNDMFPKVKINDSRQLFRFYRIKNMLTTSEIIINAALARKESRGSHQREDWPNKDDKNWLKNITARKIDDKLILQTGGVTG